MRLDKCLANSGYGSRTEVKTLIKKGSVSLNGIKLTDPGFDVTENDFPNLHVSGFKAEIHQNIHLMMNKPSGLITALDDKRLPTISDIIPEKWKNRGIFPVGRLDRDTTGLLVLTNDGTLCHRLTGPRWGIWKTYYVKAQGKPFDNDDITIFSNGLILADGLNCKPAKLEIINSQEAVLTIHEGKYHQVKRMMLATGRRVIQLHRQQTGPLILDNNLAPGKCRLLTKKEVEELYKAVDLKPVY